MALNFSPFGLIGAFHPSGIDRPGQITPARVGSRTSVTSLGVLYKNQAINIDGATGLPTNTYTSPIVGTFLGVEYTNSLDGRRIVSPYLAAATVILDPVFYVNVDPNLVYEAQIATAAGNAESGATQPILGDTVYVYNPTDSQGAGFPITAGTGTGLSRQFVSRTAPASQAGNLLTVVDHGWDNVDSDLWYNATTNTFPTIRVMVQGKNLQNS